jgi:SAM-dependent methyltransferase
MTPDLRLTEDERGTIRYYDEHAEEFCAQSVGLDLSSIYPHFLEHIPAGGHILDAGCGSGRDSLYFKRYGYLVTAFDASEALVQYSSELLGQEVLHLTFDQVTFMDEFDGVWACASLLHIPPSKAAETFTRLANALKSGGVLFAALKHGSGQREMRGRMFTFYDEDSLKELIDRTELLEVMRIWGNEYVRGDGEREKWINLLAKKG